MSTEHLALPMPVVIAKEAEARNDFDWREKEFIAIQHQPSVAVYTGSDGHICIRQEDSIDGEDDVVLVLPANLPELIERLQTFLPMESSRGRKA